MTKKPDEVSNVVFRLDAMAEKLTKAEETAQVTTIKSVPPNLYIIYSKDINKEEELLNWDVTPFPQLQQMSVLKDPYSKLWHTVAEHQEKNDNWLNGKYFIYRL